MGVPFVGEQSGGGLPVVGEHLGASCSLTASRSGLLGLLAHPLLAKGEQPCSPGLGAARRGRAALPWGGCLLGASAPCSAMMAAPGGMLARCEHPLLAEVEQLPGQSLAEGK